MYEKLMYKVPRDDNKILYNVQALTKNDNVNEDMFEEGRNSQGRVRLQCRVMVLHAEEFNELNNKVKELETEIIQKNTEIKQLQKQIAEHERQDIDYEAKLQGEKYNMLLEHQKAVDELNETHKDDLLAIDKEHLKQLDRMRSQYKQSYDEVNDRLFNSVKANNNMRGKFKAEVLAMNEAHKDEVVNLQRQHHDELDKLQHAHSNELQALREQHAYDIDTLQRALADVKQEHLTEIAEIEEQHIYEVDEVRTKFLKLLANEHAQDIGDFDDCGELPRAVKWFARGFAKSFDEFKKRKIKNTPQMIIETYELAPSRDE